MKKMIALVVAVASFAATPPKTVTLDESGTAKVGKPAPSFGGWSIDGKKVLTLDSLRRAGGEPAPLLITFGASWCVACTAGLPRLVGLSKKHQEMKLILIDVESDSSKAQEWATRMGVDGPAILDKFEQIAKTYGVSGAQGADGKETTALPRTFLVDSHNRVRAIYTIEGADLEERIEMDLSAATGGAVNASSKQ